MALSPDEISLVQGTIPALRSHGKLITTIFYGNMLREHPELNNYFNLTNQANGSQPRALTALILNAAMKIDQLGHLSEAVERTCQKHASLGITPEQYQIVGKFLLAAFGEVLGDAMTPEIGEAWGKAYWMLANAFIGREAQLYSEFDSWQGWRKFRVHKKIYESDEICSFYLVPEDGVKLPRYLPGQYISVRVPVPDLGYHQARQYSLSEWAGPDFYRISVKRETGATFGPGVISHILHDQRHVGDTVEMTHPAGEFFLDIERAPHSPIVLLSAGVGVTPMVCILNAVMEKQPARPISWIQGARHQVPFHPVVRRIADQKSSLTVNIFKTVLADSDLEGVHYTHGHRIDLSKVRQQDLWLEDPEAEYFICGPSAFMVEMARSLRKRGVEKRRIKLELFGTGELDFEEEDDEVSASASSGKPVETQSGAIKLEA